MRKIKKLVAVLLAATMMMAMGVTAFAATPTTCKFTKTNGSALKLGMDTKLIESCDLSDDNVATVVFKTYSLLGYKGDIVGVSGDAVVSTGENDDGDFYAVINMNKATTKETGVPVRLTFKFSLGITPPGMSNPMDAMFVCY
ncbi:Uncharacterised protein [[Ruminococcus] torques]|uniref:Uncharacterized protein n=1 Tax=[Ruminococcus] torques TaxID=33039 RepID=A0A564UQD9_9FIRM|nr:hypothetical protein [[Ruminococcus] torques]VUX21774.1 Uncharacterised protein [[Ruminococcus] torques]